MTKADRKGKVFVDWSQNVRHKTTIAVYSMRARPHPTVSTPVTWDEVTEAAEGDNELRFLWTDVLDRVEEIGDVFVPVLTTEQRLPAGAAEPAPARRSRRRCAGRPRSSPSSVTISSLCSPYIGAGVPASCGVAENRAAGRAPAWDRRPGDRGQEHLVVHDLRIVGERVEGVDGRGRHVVLLGQAQEVGDRRLQRVAPEELHDLRRVGDALAHAGEPGSSATSAWPSAAHQPRNSASVTAAPEQ